MMSANCSASSLMFPLSSLVAVLCMALDAMPLAQSGNTRSTTHTGEVVTAHARGTFDVKVTPVTEVDNEKTAGFGRLRLDKRFHGDLVATSVGEMLAAGTEVQGSAGYVALERITGPSAAETVRLCCNTAAACRAGTCNSPSALFRIREPISWQAFRER